MVSEAVFRWGAAALQRSRSQWRGLGILVACLWAWWATPVSAQDVLLDAQVTAGELTLYPVLGSDLKPGLDYYYLPDQVRLATDGQGRPRFSFLRYVQNQRPEAGEEAAREGDGGGIVHAIVELDVPEAAVRVAERELARDIPGARIVGPLTYRSGTFTLTSSFVRDGELTRQVVGMGKAPVLEGHRAAISIRLTKLGAQILWESLQMATSDLSFSFEMEVAGLRAPQQAHLEADFDRIYRHRLFEAAGASPLLAGEVSAAFDELRDAGAIRFTQVRGDAQMEQMIATAYEKVAALMLEPLSGTPSLTQMAGAGGQGTGLLDRAQKMLTDARSEARMAAVAASTPRPGADADEAPPRPPVAERPAANEERADGESGEPTDSEAPETADPGGDLLPEEVARVEPVEEVDDYTPIEGSCELRRAYWVVAREAEADHLEETLATFLDRMLPNWREKAEEHRQRLAGGAPDHAPMNEFWVDHFEDAVTRFEHLSSDWFGRSEVLRAEAARMRQRLPEDVMEIAESDRRAELLGEFIALGDQHIALLEWLTALDLDVRNFEDQAPRDVWDTDVHERRKAVIRRTLGELSPGLDETTEQQQYLEEALGFDRRWDGDCDSAPAPAPAAAPGNVPESPSAFTARLDPIGDPDGARTNPAPASAVARVDGDELPCDMKFAYWGAILESAANAFERLREERIRPYFEASRASARDLEQRLRGNPGNEEPVVRYWLERVGASERHWEAEMVGLNHRIADFRLDVENVQRRVSEEAWRTASQDARPRRLGEIRAILDLNNLRVRWIEGVLLELDGFEADYPAATAASELHRSSVQTARDTLTAINERREALVPEALSLHEQIGLHWTWDGRCETAPPGSSPWEELDPDVDGAPPASGPSDGWLSSSPPLPQPRSGPAWRASGAMRPIPGPLTIVQDPSDAGAIGPDDLWIVSLGDSFSSGEGNPTTIGVPLNALKWMDDERCHRSQWGWPHVVADSLAKMVPRTVYFSFLACSGGELGEGLLHPFTDRNVEREPQLDRLARLIDAAGGRAPSAVLLTGGGNDLGFADIVIECITPGQCPGGDATDSLNVRMARLGQEGGLYDSVAVRLEEMNVQPERVFFVVYPDPLKGRRRDGGRWGPEEVLAYCHHLAGKRAWGWASENVVRPLQALQEQIAERHGWQLVDGHVEEFKMHSFCPRNGPPEEDSWWVGVLGGIPRQWGVFGAFHPNRRGHRGLANAAYGILGRAIDGLPTSYRAAAVVAAEAEATVPTSRPAPGTPGGGPGSVGSQEAPALPRFAAVAALQLRKIRHQGTFEMSLDKYMPGTQVYTFPGNVGNLSRYLDDPMVFREVNLDQPLFRQREVAFILDGLDAEDFADWVNFVHVQLRRGDDVREEATIEREDFNERGNDIRLLYGFSGPESRDDWNTYEYRTVWSVFGGLTAESEWQRTRDGSVTLPAPYTRRRIELQGSPASLEGVRAVVVRLYWQAGDEERSGEVLLRPDQGQLSAATDVVLPAGEDEYGYEITWMWGNQRSETTGRQTSRSPILFIDPPEN